MSILLQLSMDRIENSVFAVRKEHSWCSNRTAEIRPAWSCTPAGQSPPGLADAHDGSALSQPSDD